MSKMMAVAALNLSLIDRKLDRKWFIIIDQTINGLTVLLGD